ncbi:MAG: tRNA 2-thiouridine(34) synthase MnmA [Desulfatiglandaceae bacterium]
MNHKKRIAVGMSGGVDSSVAAALLKEEGHDVVGIAMEIFDDSTEASPGQKHGCYGPDEKEDIELAGTVCERLGIPFHVIDLKKEYSEHVIDYFRREYLAGRTPNPCITCNRKVKFGFLLEKAREAGIDFTLFATGHYARIIRAGPYPFLARAVDKSKDQSYFLYALKPEQLDETLFPLGALTKQEVRKIAREKGLDTADRPESQDFMGGGDYKGLFEEGEIQEGDIVDEAGKCLGQHNGIIHYTVGQRRGLGISAEKPLYVKGIDPEHNRLVVGERQSLLSDGLVASDVNLTVVKVHELPFRANVKIRLRHEAAGSTLYPDDEKGVSVAFDKPQIAVTPGQSAVFYLGDMVLGGGIIERAVGPGDKSGSP